MYEFLKLKILINHRKRQLSKFKYCRARIMQKFKGVIYQAINIQNRKSYIGKTSQDFDEYKQNHIYSALKNYDVKHNQKAKYFYNAIRKCGSENFKWVILGEIFSYNLEELNQKLNEAEKDCIYFFRTFGSNGKDYDQIYGYNKTKGGDGGDTGYRLENQSLEQQNNIKNKLKYTSKNMRKNKSEQDLLKWNSKISETKYINKSNMGKNNPRYKIKNISKVILLYFCNLNCSQIAEKYNKNESIPLSSSCIKLVLKILKFPIGSGDIYHKKQKIKEQFVEENKHKIDWYIKNYERLENEYWKEKYELGW